MKNINNQNIPGTNKLIQPIKSLKMKSKNKIIKWAFLLLLILFGTTNLFAQTKTGDMSVCLNATEPYAVTDVPSSTFAWAVTTGTSGTDWIVTTTAHNTITVQWLKAGTYTLQVIETNAQQCSGNPVSIKVTVNTKPVVTAPTGICVGNTAALSPSSGGTWTSSNTAVATVDNAGIITGVSAGSVTFTFTTSNGGCSSTTSLVTVNPKPVTSPITHN